MGIILSTCLIINIYKQFVFICIFIDSYSYSYSDIFNMGNESSKSKKSSKAATFQRQNTFYTIRDKYETYDELQNALRQAGLESSNLILAIDYTKSNTVRL